MKSIGIILLYRLLSNKSMGLMVAMIVLTGVIGSYYLLSGPPLINVLMDPSLHARLYLFDTFFLVKIKLILLIMIFHHMMYGNHRMDIALLMRCNRFVLGMMKWGVPTLCVLIIASISVLIIGHIYALSHYSLGYKFNIEIFLMFYIFCLYYSTLFALFMNWVQSIYSGVFIFIGFMFSEVLHGFDPHPSRFLSVLSMGFPTISVYQNGVTFSISPLLAFVYIIAFLMVNVAISGIQKY